MRRSSEQSPPLAWLALLGAILALFGVNVGRTWDFTVDDAGISFAYARNLSAGHGMVLTPGSERVEAATNFLWVLLLTPADWVGVSHETLSKVLGLAFAACALGAIAAFPAAAYDRRPRYYDLLAPLVASTFAHVCLWTASGLENGLFQFLLAASVTLVAHEENSAARFPWSSVSLALLFATRPDGALYAVAVFAAKALRGLTGDRRRQDLLWAITLGLLVASLELFRLAYFAYPFPNSFYTKKRTFDFGKDLTRPDSPGWVYVGSFVRTYKLKRTLIVLPAMLLAARAPVARLSLGLCVVASFFLPVYAHGDWMEEWRFLTFGVPLLALSLAEALRALSRIVLGVTPRSLRAVVAFALTPFAGYFVVAESTRVYPARFDVTRRHETLDFATVRGRARYFANAARRLDVHNGSVLDPDVGGMSYDSGLQVIDLFGLGDVAVARTHPVDPPGLRETLFSERRPTFVHLHGAWFGAVQLDRLEELEQLYFRLPPVIDDGHDDATNYVRRDDLAAPWTETAELGPALTSRGPTWTDGYTVSARGTDPDRPVVVELTFAALAAGSPGMIVAEPTRGGARVESPLRALGELIPGSAVLPGERPAVRARLRLTPGRYDLRWRNEGGDASLGPVEVAPGADARDLRATTTALQQAIAQGRMAEARRFALALRLRAWDDPRPGTRATLAPWSRLLAERAVRLGEHGLFDLAAQSAAEAQRFALGDAPTQTLVQRLAERMADTARERERHGDIASAFELARDAVLLDPRRSWMRRRAEDLRPRRLSAYDGGREVAAYRFAVRAAEKLNTGPGTATEFDPALRFLGSVRRPREAALLARRAGVTPVDPWARLAVARGRLILGDPGGAAELVASVPCTEARDPSLHEALRALQGRAPRPSDAQCLGATQRPQGAATGADGGPVPLVDGSFERSGWGTWTAEGTAFGRGPLQDTPANQTMVNGWRGRRFASSYASTTDAARGTLRSRPFTVTHPGLSFLIAGGSDVGRVGVRMRVGDQVVLQAAGNNTEGLRRVFWDVSAWRGQTAVVELYDDSDQSWGHILADDFLFEPVCPRF
jgi:hypothetical protein